MAPLLSIPVFVTFSITEDLDGFVTFQKGADPNPLVLVNKSTSAAYVAEQFSMQGPYYPIFL